MKHLLILALALSSVSLRGQIQFYSLDEVFRYADGRAISIQNAVLSEELARIGQKEALAGFLPSSNLSLGFNDNITLQPALVPAQAFNPAAPDDAVEELTFGARYNYTAGLNSQWDLINFPQWFAFQTAKIEVEQSSINTEVQRYRTYQSLASTYYSILLSQESIRLYEENVRVAESILATVSDKYEGGIVSEAERNQAEIKLRQSQRSLVQVQHQLEQFYVQFQSQLNTNEAVFIQDDIKAFELANTELPIRHPEVRWQEVEVDKYGSLLQQSKAARLPSRSLVYQNNHTWATDNLLGLGSANHLPQQIIGVQNSMTGLFNPGKRRRIEQSKRTLELQQMQLDYTRLAKQKEDELLQLQWHQSVDQLSEQTEILALQTENDGYAEHQYEGGIISLDQRLGRYDELLLVQDQYLQSLATHTLAQYQIYIRQIDYQSWK